MYYSGQSIPQDYPEAAKWYRLAAAQGDNLAQFNLGYMYDKGQGVAQDSTSSQVVAFSSRSDPDSEFFHATGVTLIYDQEPWFVRLAWDPKVNFTASDMTRLALGIRF